MKQTNRATAVQFGAGNIGRGFIAQLFHESGYDVVFVDVIEPVIAALNDRHSYTVHIVGDGACEVPISGVMAIPGGDTTAVAEAVASCDVACTAVGAGALKYIAPNLAAGLLKRRRGGGGPLNVLVCENLHEAGKVLAGLVGQSLPDSEREAILTQTGFVQAVVSRMAPIQSPDPGAPLDVRVEAYKRLPVDAAAIVGALPSIVGVEPVSRFEAHEARKLFTHNCAHATLGYLGWLRGIEYGYEALEDRGVRARLDAVLEETGEGLVRTFGFDPAEHAAHVADLLKRFANKELGDTCFRLARDPVRKLGPSDRLVGAARMCEAAQTPCANLAVVIAAALRFAPPDDSAAQELQARIREGGVERAMADVAGIAPSEPLGRAVLRAYASDELTPTSYA